MPCQGRPRRESGAILIIFMVVIAVGAIALTAAAQAWSTTWRRDSEEELIFRANQYVLGIIAYRKEHGGQFPLRLEDLNKPGPRRYVRKLYKDPITRDGKWGLLYLMPGGKQVYDPRAAQLAQDKAKKEWGSDWESAGTGTTAQMPGVTSINPNQLGAGVPGTGGAPPGSPPIGLSGAMPTIPQLPPGMGGTGQLSGGEESVSEPPIGWPIVGVISRATGKSASDTFKTYKGHEQVDDWQFHVFDLGEPMQQPGSPANFPSGPGSVGPGFGGKGMGGIGGGARPGMMGGGWGNRRDQMMPGMSGGGNKGGYNPQNPYGNVPPNTYYPPGTYPPKQQGQQNQGGGDQGNP